jgi:1A family penicillin-binding protein
MRARLLVAAVIVLMTGGFYAAYRTVRFTRSVGWELDRSSELANLRPRAQSTVVLDRHGRPAFTFYAERRTDIPLERVSRHMIDAILSVEDRRFHSHYGLDPFRIAAAAWRNVRSGRIVEGGSTITQQLARASHLSSKRTFDRKIREAFIALRLEERYTKQQILQEYLNTVYFGAGYYGVEAAARGYFAKSAADLSPAEAALLAAVVRAPSTDAPGVSPDRARRRRDLVLRLMHQQARLSDTDLRAAVAAPLPSGSDGGHAVAEAPTGGYFQEEVRRRLIAMFGVDRVLRGGLRVHSTFDPALQKAAEAAVHGRLAEIAKMRKSAADLQGSLVAIDPATGDVLAMVGGRSFRESSFNRATQAHRQAGSAFKPILYAAALERGYAPGSLLRDLDTPIEGADGTWLPNGEHEAPEYTLRAALKTSSNRAAAQLMRNVGVATTVDYAHRFGIESDLPLVPSLALGTGEVTLLELTTAYGVFANGGRRMAPRLITRIDDADGALVWMESVDSLRVISPTTAFLMSSMLADVVSTGTATGVRAAGFTLPSGGKTGTTDDYADAWFVGYTPHLVAGVWFGLDTPAPIMRRGFAGTVAVPAWARFMKAATRGAKPEWYDVPADVEKVAICRISGARAGDGCRHGPAPEWRHVSGSWSVPFVPALEAAQPPVYEDYFPIGVIPADVCTMHNGASDDVAASSMGRYGIDGVSSVRTTGSHLVTVERRTRADGTVAIIMKGGNR